MLFSGAVPWQREGGRLTEFSLAEERNKQERTGDQGIVEGKGHFSLDHSPMRRDAAPPVPSRDFAVEFQSGLISER